MFYFSFALAVKNENVEMQTKIKLPKVVIVIVFIMYFNMTQKEIFWWKKTNPKNQHTQLMMAELYLAAPVSGMIFFTLLAVTLLNLTGKPECDKGSSVVSNQTWQMIQGCCSSSHILHAIHNLLRHCPRAQY